MSEPDLPISAEDRVALLRQGIVIVETGLVGGRVHVGVTGFGRERVYGAVTSRLGCVSTVELLGDLPRHLEARRCLGHMEREPGRLQVRLELCGEEHVDQVVVAEDGRAVAVLAMVCTSAAGEVGERCEVPVHVYLEGPLAGRQVVDGTSGELVPYKNVYATLGGSQFTQG